jgi:hypothetical protein
LEDTSITWDSTVYGEISQNWDEELLDDGAMLSSCKYKYMSECAAQYDSCMALVADNEDSENDENNQQQPSSTAPVSLKEHLECTPIDMDTFNSMSQKKQTYKQNAYGENAQVTAVKKAIKNILVSTMSSILVRTVETMELKSRWQCIRTSTAPIMPASTQCRKFLVSR